MGSESTTLRDAISAGARRLAGNADLSATAARDAEVLLLYVLELQRSSLYAHPDLRLSEEQQMRYAAAIGRRLGCEPIQYITGTQEFFGLMLEVAPGVLIPRPETELLVEAVLDRVSHHEPLEIVDVGTGTGAIAIALASRLPKAKIVAVDRSAAALDIVRRNTRRLGLEGRLDLVSSDLLDGVKSSARGFDAIVSNPPYVPSGDRAGMHPQVRDFEPAEALFAGSDGLDVYRRLIPQAREALRAGGLLAVEIGHGQQLAIAGLLSGWLEVDFLDDLQGIPRVAVALRP